MSDQTDTLSTDGGSGVEETGRELRRDLERGLQFGNVLATVVQEQANEAVAYAQALLELLVRKGVVDEDELRSGPTSPDASPHLSEKLPSAPPVAMAEVAMRSAQIGHDNRDLL